MRDRNHLTPAQFHIQLQRKSSQVFTSGSRFPRLPVSKTPTLWMEDSLIFHYPRSFRTLRALCVAHWYFPEELFWRVHLDLLERSFRWLTKKQRIELLLYLDSQFTSEAYLLRTQRLTGNEIFGNILGNDLREALKILHATRKSKKVVYPIWRRGFRDKGSRKPDSEWLPKEDYSFTEMQLRKEEEEDHLQILVKTLIQKLRDQTDLESKTKIK